MNPKRFRRFGLVTLLSLFGASTVLALWAVVAIGAWSAYSDTYAKAERMARRLALTLDQNLQARLGLIEHGLDHIAAGTDPVTTVPPDTTVWLRIDRHGPRVIGRPALALGDLRALVTLAETACADAGTQRLRAVPPWVPPGDGHKRLPLVRCGDHGATAGSATALALTEHDVLARLFTDLSVGGGLGAAAWLPGGIPWIRAGMAAGNDRPTPEVRQAVARLSAMGDISVFAVHVTRDSSEHLTVIRALETASLVVTIGLELDDVFVDWRQATQSNAAAAAALTLVVVLLTSLLIRRIIRERGYVSSLQHSEEKLRLAHQLGKLGHFEQSLDTGRLEWSASLYEIWGRDPQHFIPTVESLLEQVHPDDRALAEAEFQRPSSYYEFRITGSDGSVRHLATHGVVEPTADQSRSRYFGVTQDISERREREFDLISAVQQTRLLVSALEAIPTAIAISDPHLPDRPIVFVNRAFLETTGYDADEVIGRNSRFLEGPQTDPDTLAKLREAIAERRSIRLELITYRKTGDMFWSELATEPVYNDDGELVAFVSALKDITREHEHQTRLRQFQKMEALGQLAGGLAHELNNLLQPVMTFSQMSMRALPSGSRLWQYQQSILESSRRAREIIRNILTFAQGGAPKNDVVDLIETIQSVTKFATDLIPSTVTIHPSLAVASVKSRVNATELFQVLLNLLSNAADAMEQHGDIYVSIELRCLPAAEATVLQLSPGPFAVISVRDTGHGMDQATRARIFEPFYTTKPVGHGTGLGLSIAYGIVRRWDGTITVDSAVGHGTLFRVIIPVMT